MVSGDCDVTTLPSPDVQLSALVKTLCDKSAKIKADICSLLSKTGFSDVSASDMSGRGNTKVTKLFLAERVISLIESIDNVNDFMSPILVCDTSTDALNNIRTNSEVKLSTPSQENYTELLLKFNNISNNYRPDIASIQDKLDLLQTSINKIYST